MVDDTYEYEEMKDEVVLLHRRNNALRNSLKANEHYQFLFTHSPYGIAYHKMIYENGVPVDYIFVETNEAFEKLTGLNDIKGKKVTEVIPEMVEQNPELFEIYGKVASTRKEKKIEVYFEPLKRWFSISLLSPRKGYFTAVFEDITQRKVYEEALKESEEKFRKTFETIDVGITLTNESGDIIDCNKASEHILGISKEEHLKRNYAGKEWKIIRTDYTPMPTSEYASVRALKENTTISNLEMGIVRDKDVTWIAVCASPIPLKGYGVVVTYVDITAQKQIEHDLSVAKEKAIESDHLKSEFINNMSHEIRTPMNGILGFSELLQKKNIKPDKQKHFVDIIQNSSKQLMRIIDDILEISKLGTKQVKAVEELVNLNDTMLHLFSIFDVKAKENKTPLYLKKGLLDHESEIYTDLVKLNKILCNLLENALKFTRTGYIELGYTLLENGHAPILQLYVKDTGIGIQADKQTLIFDRFSQEEKSLSHNFGGLGLGLSIAKENSELLGGEIILESQKGKGATFYLNIPYKTDLNKNISKSSENDVLKNKFEKCKHTVLVVEDEEVNHLFIETLLEEEFDIKINILHARNGEDAVELCKKNIDICLVLMDIKMPGIDGFEAAILIKQLRPDLPIVVQTAYSTDEYRDKALSTGCDDFITKPIKIEIFRDIINKYVVKL